MCDVPAYFGEPVIVPRENDLYRPFEGYLLQGFHELHKPRQGSLFLVTAVTAQVAAPAGGTWTQPDLAAVAVSRSKFATVAELQIFSFEVKTFVGCNLQAVHEVKT